MSDLVNGLDPKQFPPAVLVDFDGVVFEEGTNEMICNVDNILRRMKEGGMRLYIFSCGASPERIAMLERLGVTFDGVIPKPLACEYHLIDDRFAGGAVGL